jgi:hypothetical protein
MHHLQPAPSLGLMAGNAIGMLETARGMLQNAPATRLAISTDSAGINEESKKKGGLNPQVLTLQ